MNELEMNIPALRFPDFQGEWELKKLGEVIKSIDSGWSPQCEEYQAKINEWGVLKTTAVVWEGFDESENKKLPSNLLAKVDIEVKANDILITRAGPTNRVGVAVHVDKVRERLMLSDKIIRIRTSENNSSKFVSILLANDEVQKQLVSKSSGLATSQTNISQSILLNISLHLPTLSEQNKIAGFLSAVDEKLQQLKQEKAHLVQYKKGVMQQIFNQEIRFKDDDGNEFAEWEEKSLGDVCEIKKGEQLNVTELSIKGSYAALNGGINPSGYTEKWNTDANTIAISEGGNSCGYVNFIKNKFWSGGHCYSLKNIQTYIDSFYLFQFLKYIEPSIMRLRVGSGLPNIQKTALSDLNFQFPNKLEQTKIANFLSAIDDKITNITNQITLTEQWKKGLLQKMFV